MLGTWVACWPWKDSSRSIGTMWLTSCCFFRDMPSLAAAATIVFWNVTLGFASGGGASRLEQQEEGAAAPEGCGTMRRRGSWSRLTVAMSRDSSPPFAAAPAVNSGIPASPGRDARIQARTIACRRRVTSYGGASSSTM